MIQIGKIEKTCIIAFTVRLLVLLIVVMFAENLSFGFYGTDFFDLDDCRYLAGAESYLNNASSIVDVDCFTRSFEQYGDRTGYILSDPSSTPLWYWIVCIVSYLTRTTLTVRLLNVIFATSSIYYFYSFVNLLYGEKIALLSAKLLAFLPYPVLFCCFAYKDSFLMYCSFFILFGAMSFQKNEKISKIRLIIMIVLAIAMLNTRSGLSALFLVVAFLIAFKKYVTKINVRNIIITLVLLAIAGLVIYKSSSTLIFKLNYYFERSNRTVTGPIRHIMITKITDIYKLPFCYILSVIEPIGLPKSITCWSDLVDLTFPVMVPISLGSFLYMFKRNKKNGYTFWLCMLVYLVTITASLTNIRHYYSMLPITYTAFVNYVVDLRGKKRLIFIAVSFVSIIALYAAYMYTH